MFRSAACRFGRYAMLATGILVLLFSGEYLANGRIKDATVGIAFGVLTLGVCVLSWRFHLRAPEKWCRHNY